MYAIVQTGGKQYKVSEGDTLFIEKLEAEAGAEVTFDQVLFVSKDGNVVVGSPVIAGATVSATVLKNGKAKKILVFKYKSKKNYRRKAGHRQPYTQVQIAKINA